MKFVRMALLAACLTAAGCAPENRPVEPEPTTTVAPPFKLSSITHGQMCDAVLQFFGRELKVYEAGVYPLDNRDGTMEIGGHCPVRQGSIQIGYWQTRSDPSPDPTEGAKRFDKTLEVSGRTVFIDDERPDPTDTLSGVTLATRVGEFNSQLSIWQAYDGHKTRAEDGPLSISDSQLESAARFIVDVTSRLDAGTW
ncbi:hypothetical protein [Nocardia rhizosphaerihabitans]|nr:hypothetical protein [Nocardia rhizosphaerihabitans]